MILTVIIVNYNVKYFLEQCLQSVLQASSGIPAEVYVVDNASDDDSIGFLQPKFPSVVFLANKTNTGFSKANNQALRLAKGKYVLFLNPDTKVPSDCFQKCIHFMESHQDAGALGVRMVDGEGRFLKESKRGFPGPLVSFWKMTGITAMFNRSGYFARYYMGNLSATEINKVDILSGAFMFVRKNILDKTGGFDERFFMYAEDIDLSWRILNEGYSNYYLGNITIVHYKGESTRKNFNYVKLFYRSMSQFVRKYYGSGLYAKLLDVAIVARAGLHLILPAAKRKKNNPAHDQEP